MIPPAAADEGGAAAPPGKDRDAWRAVANIAMDKYLAGEDTFSTLYQTLAPRLQRYLLLLTGDAAQAEDVVQQTMMQIHLKRDLFVRGAAVGPWAFAIAHRLLIDTIRRLRREEARVGMIGRSEPEAEMGTDDVLHAKHVARVMERELAQLPAHKRMFVEMTKRDGLSMREVGDRLGMSENAVKLRASRACAALRASVRRSEIGEETVLAANDR